MVYAAAWLFWLMKHGESLSAIASESMMTAVFQMYGAVISRLGCFSVGGADGRQAERSSKG
jgi:hypothetical protein